MTLFHWFHYQWFAYWWPSDKGNGPENLTWSVLAGIVVALCVPLVRHYFEQHMKSLHAKMDHIIEHHPDIPTYIEPEFERFEHWLLVPYRWLKRIATRGKNEHTHD